MPCASQSGDSPYVPRLHSCLPFSIPTGGRRCKIHRVSYGEGPAPAVRLAVSAGVLPATHDSARRYRESSGRLDSSSPSLAAFLAHFSKRDCSRDPRGRLPAGSSSAESRSIPVRAIAARKGVSAGRSRLFGSGEATVHRLPGVGPTGDWSLTDRSACRAAGSSGVPRGSEAPCGARLDHEPIAPRTLALSRHGRSTAPRIHTFFPALDNRSSSRRFHTSTNLSQSSDA
jgi:hypothetical protein